MPSCVAENPMHEAKEDFANAVREGIAALMSQCGYSRDRATSALLREIARGEDRPDEKKQFEAMEHYGLGLEEASRALLVSKSLQKMLDTGLSPVKAIQQLASKISISNLLYDSSDDDPTSDGDMPTFVRRRIEPVSTRFNHIKKRSLSLPSASTTRATAVATRRSNVSSGPSSSSKVSKSKSRNPARSAAATTGRKRGIDDITPSSAEEKANCDGIHARPRADSAAEAVDAKMAKQSSANHKINSEEVGVRGKRVHRLEEQETASPAAKRRIL